MSLVTSLLNILKICHLDFFFFLPDSETNGLSLTTAVEGVFHASVGSYNLNYNDAQRVFEIHGATLATYNQPYAAWSAGLERCAYVNLFYFLVFFFLSFVLSFFISLLLSFFPFVNVSPWDQNTASDNRPISIY